MWSRDRVDFGVELEEERGVERELGYGLGCGVEMV